MIIGVLTFALTAHAAPTVCQIGNGCTGTSTAPGYGKLLIGGQNGEYELMASSTLTGFAPVQSVFGRTGAVTAQSGDYTTSLVPEGSNLYWTQIRFDSALSATTSVKSITSLPSLSLPYSQLTGTPDLSQYLTLSAWYGTTTDQLREGSNNLYFTNARADARFVSDLVGTSSVASITTLPSLSLPYGQVSGAPSLPVSIANGGTATSTQVTNGVNYFNGTMITSGTNLAFDGNVFSVPFGSAASPSYTFVGSTTNGMYLVGGATPALDFATAGTKRLQINSNDITVTPPIVGNVGTIAKAGYTFTGSQGTGMYSPTTNQLGLTSNGAERLRINASGLIGVATSTPWGLLSLNCASLSSPCFVISTSTATFAATTTAFLMDPNGNIEIGTTTPTNALTFGSDRSVSGIALYNTSDQTTNFERGTISFNATNDFQFLTAKGGAGTSRNILFNTPGSSQFLIRDGGSGLAYFDFSKSAGNTNTAQMRITGAMSASSLTNAVLSLLPTIAQTGTAGYSGIRIQPTETTLGSGSHLLIQAGTSTATDLMDLTNLGQLLLSTTTAPSLKSLLVVGSTTQSVGPEATSTIFLDSGSTKGGCIVIKDVDGSGYTYITANNGVLTASTASCQ